MKISNAASFVAGAALMLGIGIVSQTRAQAPNHIYELRKYFANPGKLDNIEARFRNDTIRIFAKHGLHAIGYWQPIDNKDNAMLYVLEHNSEADAKKNWAEFMADPEWQAVSKASDANGKIVNHVESTYMTALDFSPMK
jgi:hypothetical protein